jgi:hypothetical protein
MTTPDTVPTIEQMDYVQYLKDKKDFFSTDGKFSGLNSEYAYVVRHEDIAICILCCHGQLYVRRDPRPEWGVDSMMSVLIAYGMGTISHENTVPCSDKAMEIACMAHGVLENANTKTELPDLLDLARRIMRKPGE